MIGCVFLHRVFSGGHYWTAAIRASTADKREEKEEAWRWQWSNSMLCLVAMLQSLFVFWQENLNMVCDTQVFSRATQYAMAQLSEDEISFELIEVKLYIKLTECSGTHHVVVYFTLSRVYWATSGPTILQELCSSFFLDGTSSFLYIDTFSHTLCLVCSCSPPHLTILHLSCHPGSREYMLLPCHSQLPRDEQRRVFSPTPPGVTKVSWS